MSEYSAEEIQGGLTGSAPPNWAASDPAWEYQSPQTDDQGNRSSGYFINPVTGDRRDANSVEGKSRTDRLTEVDVSGLPTHKNPNFEGTPTEFYDESGALSGFLTDPYRWNAQGARIVDPKNFNLALKEGESPSMNSYVQTVNDQNQLMYIDPYTGKNTTDNTGVPATNYQLKDLLYMNPTDKSGMAQDWRGLGYMALAAAAGAAGGGAFGGELGAGALGGEVATAYPVVGGGALGGTELGAVGVGGAGVGGAGAGGIGAGSLTTGITPASVAAFEAALPATMAEIGGLAAPSLTAAEALRYASLAKSALGATGALGGATNRSGGSGTLAQMNPLNQQYLSTGAAPTTNVSGLIDYKPLPFAEPTRYANVSDIKPLSMFDKNIFQSGLHAAHGGHIQESMGRHSELQDIDPRLLSMIMQSMAFQDGDKRHVPEFITGATGHYVKGKGDGQSDDIPAMLADGEFVWDADTVAQLGNGSSDAGAKFLDKFREAVRSHKRSAPNDKIPPKASPLQYVKEAMKNTEKE